MRARLAALAAALAVISVAGCGGGGGASTAATSHPQSTSTSRPSTPTSQPVVDADPGGQLKFTKRQLTAIAGKVTLVMHNPSSIEHNIAIKGGDVDVRGKLVGHGGTSTVTANLKPDTYTFYCAVPGHEAAGMTGTLRVP